MVTLKEKVRGQYAGMVKNLVFEGGITSSRGHAGDSVGRSALEARLLDSGPADDGAPVFGCSLHRDDPDCDHGRAQPTPTR